MDYVKTGQSKMSMGTLLFKEVGISKYLIAIIYIVPILTYKEGFMQMVAATIVFAAMGLLFFTDEFYSVLPILLFFYNLLVLPGGIVLFRVYSILMFVKLLKQKIHIDLKILFPFAVITLYSVFTIVPLNIRLAVFIIFDIVFLILYIKAYLYNKNHFDRFFRLYVIAALSATVFGVLRMTGQINTAIYVDGSWVYINRFIATYNDPNYLGFFFNIAIFAAISLKPFQNRVIQLGIIGVLYLALIATLSTTAILCNAFGIFIYLITAKKINLKSASIVAFSIIILVASYQIALYREIPVLTDAAVKVKSRINELDESNMSSFTTQRTDIWERHMESYFEQSVFMMLFGGNAVNSYICDETKYKTASHQEFIDMLLNFGIVGTLIMLAYYFLSVLEAFRRLTTNGSNQDVMRIMVKYVWFFYALGLTMFPGWMFYIFFFL